MNINHLEYFDEVCKQGSVTKAAHICSISQPTITAAINGLESELGFKLFYRVCNKLKITDMGQQYHIMVKEFLTHYNSFNRKAMDIHKAGYTLLNVGVPAILGTSLVGEIFPRFSEEHPNIRLKIHETPSLEGLERLKHSTLDFLFGVTGGNDETPQNLHDSTLLSRTHLKLVLSKDHPYALAPIATKEMISNLPLIVLTEGTYHHKAISQAYDDIPLNILMFTSQLSTIKYLVKNNLAATIIYGDLFAADDQVVCLNTDVSIPANIKLFWQKNSYISRDMQQFIKYAQSINL